MLKKAEETARKAHRGQVDKGGQPYILHPLRVAAGCEGTEEKIVALLHDVIEDTALTEEDLRTAGFSERVLQAVACLTHREGESYGAYIERICQNPLAARVKLADLSDNMNLARIPHPTEKDIARREKYERAKTRILAAGKEGNHDRMDKGKL